MRRLSFFVLGLSTSLAGCVDDGVEEDLGTSTAAIGPPTTLTLYRDADFSGTSMSVPLEAFTSDGTITLVTKPEVEAAGLLDRVSSVRLGCGPRTARVVLFDSWNDDDTSFATWSHLGGNGATIECTPFSTTSVDLHAVHPAIADRVASAILVTHGENATHDNFSDFLEPVWATALDQLPPEASPTGTTIWLSAMRRFQIRQFLSVDGGLFCPTLGAVFEYEVTIDDDGTFDASVADLYVDSSEWDPGWCRPAVESALADGLADGAVELEDGLDTLVAFLEPAAHDHYYFVPDGSLQSFDLFYAHAPVIQFSQLSVSKTGTGTGTVTSSPAGISCGATCSALMTGTVTLTATPSSNSFLKAWSGAGTKMWNAKSRIPMNRIPNCIGILNTPLKSRPKRLSVTDLPAR